MPSARTSSVVYVLIVRTPSARRSALRASASASGSSRRRAPRAVEPGRRTPVAVQVEDHRALRPGQTPREQRERRLLGSLRDHRIRLEAPAALEAIRRGKPHVVQRPVEQSERKRPREHEAPIGRGLRVGRGAELAPVELRRRAPRSAARGRARAGSGFFRARRRARGAARLRSPGRPRAEWPPAARRGPPGADARPRERPLPPGVLEGRDRRRRGESPPPARLDLPTGTSRPFSPSRTSSGTPPTAVAITGVPTARASTTVCGKFSQDEVRSEASAARKSVSTPSRFSGPRKRTRPSRPSSATLRRRSGRSGPSPAIARVTPSTRTRASRATSSAFCFVIRPANASSGPSTSSCRARLVAIGKSGSGGAAFGSTVTRSRGTPQLTASAARYPLGQTRWATRRSARSRAFRSARTRSPPPKR